MDGLHVVMFLGVFCFVCLVGSILIGLTDGEEPDGSDNEISDK